MHQSLTNHAILLQDGESEAGCPTISVIFFVVVFFKSVDTVSRKAFRTVYPQKESCFALGEVCADVGCV